MMSDRIESRLRLGSEVLMIPCGAIVPNPAQPRTHFDSAAIAQLADSIALHGILQPLLVRRVGENCYELVAGERRLRAAKSLNLEAVPCVLAEMSDQASAEAAVIENLLRKDLDIFEEASAIASLMENYGMTQEKVAEKLLCSQSCVANKLRLLRLTASERDLILVNRLSERHARALLRIADRKKRVEVLNAVIDRELNVVQTEELVASVLHIFTAEKKKTENPVCRDVSSFRTLMHKAIASVKANGSCIECSESDGSDYTEIIIRIPKEA